jgi:hypothetical protein
MMKDHQTIRFMFFGIQDAIDAPDAFAADDIDSPFFGFFAHKFRAMSDRMYINPRQVEWPFVESLSNELNTIAGTFNHHADLFLEGKGDEGEIESLNSSMVNHSDWKLIHNLIHDINVRLRIVGALFGEVIAHPIELKAITEEEWEALYSKENNQLQDSI